MLEQRKQFQKGRIETLRLGDSDKRVFLSGNQKSPFHERFGARPAEADKTVMAALSGNGYTICIRTPRFGNKCTGPLGNLLRTTIYAEQKASRMIVLNSIVSFKDPVPAQSGIFGTLSRDSEINPVKVFHE